MITGKSEKQVKYANDLLEQYIQPKRDFIKSQEKFIAHYEEKIASGDCSRNWMEKIEARRVAICKEQNRIDAALAITDAGELIDALKTGMRSSLF